MYDENDCSILESKFIEIAKSKSSTQVTTIPFSQKYDNFLMKGKN
jgi:hypothetical protein